MSDEEAIPSSGEEVNAKGADGEAKMNDDKHADSNSVSGGNNQGKDDNDGGVKEDEEDEEEEGGLVKPRKNDVVSTKLRTWVSFFSSVVERLSSILMFWPIYCIIF